MPARKPVAIRPTTTSLQCSKRRRGNRVIPKDEIAKIPLAEQVLGTMVTIKGKDDFVMRHQGHDFQKVVFFIRETGGAITAVWDDPNVKIASFGSAKERRALFARQERARKKVQGARQRRVSDDD